MPQGYRTMDGIDFNDIWYGGAGIQAAVDLYRRVELPIITSLAMPWPETLMKYGISNRNGFQPLGPGERPNRKTIEIATMYPDVQKYGYGVGTDLDTLRRSTGREIMLDLNRPMQEDPENVLTVFLQTMLNGPDAQTNNSKYSFYNGQYATEEKITAPPVYQQNTFSSNHTHYLAKSGGLASTDFTDMKQTIREHGHKGGLAAFINSNGVQQLEDLAAFTQASIIRSPVTDQVAVAGFNDVFTIWGITFHSTEMMPNDYVLVVETSPVETGRPLVMYEPANMRGLTMHPGPANDYPLIESFWDRWFGVKVFQRGAGAVLYYGHSTSYSTPTLAGQP
ncbi:MAG TPA: hypothetical protein VLA89_13520 [Gemmatimonadales bacterium]|nr:hypothetical protein [Gemmatimonadales bacterium]